MSGHSITVSKTSGGIPVVVENIPGSESIAYMIGVATGSRDETSDIFGLSHLLEHTVFRETKTMDSYQMAKEIEGAGGELNAFTGREMTAFYGITINETADVARRIVGDIVANPLINENATELEKKIVLQELSMVKSEPERYIHDLFSMVLWKGHELCQDEGGDEKLVAGMTYKDLRAYYDEKYRIPNLSVYAVGTPDMDETVAWAEETLDGMAGGKRNVRTAPPTPKGKYEFVASDSEHYQVAMGFEAYGASHKDRTAASMLSAILGSGTSSRLFQDVREKKALVYSIFNSISQNSDASSFATYMSCTKGNVIEAMETTSQVLGKFLAEGLEKGELERAKRLVKGSNIRAMESTDNRLYRLGVNHMLNESTETLEQRLQKIDAVTEDDVMRVARDILKPDQMNIVVLGKNNRTFKKLDLSSFAF
ncbi:pitrilysin family protein [Methanomassiliicoccales archaeon LGM-RCC1]|nr:pitrilysin family protein [Methanomassiliicoccales archaeon LGM-RCC1]